MNFRSMVFILFVCIFAASSLRAAPASAATQATYYVSTNGSDLNPGTKAQPFATIAKARDVIRTINGDMTGDIIVYIRGGTYVLDHTIDLNQADSGTNGYPIIYRNYPGEKPVISGGIPLTGWTLHDAAKTIYKAAVPQSFDTRQLYVNDLRAVRARGNSNPAGWSGISSEMYSSTEYASNENTVNVVVDLGSSQSVGAVKLYPRAAVDGVSPDFPVDFTIQLSGDGTNYTTVKTVTDEPNPNGIAQTYTFTAANARYVKLNATKLGVPSSDEPTKYRLQLVEMEIRSSGNLALGQPVTADSSNETSDWGVANLTDGATDSASANKGYSSNGFSSNANTVNVTTDLGAIQPISVVKLYPRTCYSPLDAGCSSLDGESPNFPVDFTIQLSADGTNYTTVKTVTNQSNPYTTPQQYTFAQTNARYIKIGVTRLGIPSITEPETYRLQLAELMAFSSENLALNKPVTSNNTLELGGIGAAKLTDGWLIAKDHIGFNAPDASMSTWKNINDMEVVLGYWWYMNRAGISAINGTAVWMDPSWGNTGVTNQTPSWIENAYELMDQEGEWYLDKTGAIDGTSTPKIYYKPRYGENMLTANVIVANVETLLLGKGTLDNPIRNIQFYGLSFEHAGWLDPNSARGYIDTQAGFKINETHAGYQDIAESLELENWVKMSSAVNFYAAKSIVFERNRFTRLGGAALNFEYGSQDNTIIGNRFEDISGGGIFLGDIRDHHPNDSRAINKNNTIKNNYITRTGVEYVDTVGIWAGYTENTDIQHNEIFNVPYSGISVGWGWGDYDAGGSKGFTTATVAKNNKIQYNYIHHVMQANDDGGHIYIQGNQGSPSAYSLIAYNYLDSSQGNFGSIYLDSGSQYFNIHHNVVAHPYSNWALLQRHNANTSRNALNNLLQYNYTDTAASDIGPNNTVSNNTVVTNGNWPAEAQSIMSNAGIEAPYQDIKVSSTANMALGQPVTASNSLEFKEWGIGKLTDGLRNECYTSESYTSKTNTASATVDLGTVRTLGSVKLYPRGSGQAVGGGSPGFPVDFTIQVSADNISFRTVKTIVGQSNPFGKGQEYAFAPTSARYIKINATKLGDPASDAPSYYNLQLAELEAYSPSNAAWGKPVTATNSLEIPGWSSAYLTDGNTSFVYNNAGYSSQAYTSSANNVFVQVDLGSTLSIDSVRLTPRSDGATASGGGTPNFPVDFTIQVSTDGTNYTTVATVSGQPNPNGLPQLYKFAPVDARYVKVNATKLGVPENGSSYYLLQLSEMEVFANGNLARGKPATATHSLEIPGWSLQYLNDGHTAYVTNNSGYTSVGYTSVANEVYAQIDLSSNQTVGSVKLWPRLDGAVTAEEGTPNFPVDYTIQLSTDGTNYTTVKTVTAQPNPGGAPVLLAFAPTSARYVKVNATKLGTPESGSIYHLLQLSELEIFN